jgi:hypothetical protein
MEKELKNLFWHYSQFYSCSNHCEDHNFKVEYCLYCVFTAETTAVLKIFIGGWYVYVNYICASSVALTETVVT